MLNNDEFDIVNNFVNIDENITYLNSSSRSIIPSSTERIGISCLSSKGRFDSVIIGDNDPVKSVREQYANLIGADSNDIAISNCTSSAISLCSTNCIRLNILKQGKEILILENEIGSVVIPWQIACNATGSNLKIITKDINSLNKDISWTDLIISEICNNSNIAIISLPNVHWCDGSIIDLIKISNTLDNIIYDVNNPRPLLIIDGTQSIGVLPIDIKLIKPTFIACSIHKWLCGPYGLSIMYIDSKFHSLWNPIDNNEKSLIGSEDTLIWDEIGVMNTITGYPINYMRGAKKFDSGGRPNPIIIPMINESLRLITIWKPINIYSYLTYLTDYFINELEKLIINNFCKDIFIIFTKSNRCGHIIGLKIKNDNNNFENAINIGKILNKNNIYISVRSGSIRISPYIFNTIHDMDKILKILCLI